MPSNHSPIRNILKATGYTDLAGRDLDFGSELGVVCVPLIPSAPVAGDHYPCSSIPEDLLRAIFHHLRQTVTVTAITGQSFSLGQDATFSIGPPLSITGVSRYWRSVALSEPHLWSSMVLVLEQRNILKNPGHFLYHLQHSGKVSLTLIIGGPSHLSGPGAKGESPIRPFEVDGYLAELALRARELAFAAELTDTSNHRPFNADHQFPLLEKLTVNGVPSSESSVDAASFWDAPKLRSIVWAGSSFSRPPILLPHWLNLVELVIADEWTMALHVRVVRYFLSLASLLVRLQCRIREYSEDSDNSSLSVPPSFEQDPFPPLVLCRLRRLRLTFQGVPRSDDAPVPIFLQDLSTPYLQSLEYRTDWSAHFNPLGVVSWIGGGSPCRLTYLSCLVSIIDMPSLVEGIKDMPFLETLKCVGGVAGNYDDCGRITLLLENPTYNVYADDQFLMGLAKTQARGTSRNLSLRGVAEAPCSSLRELEVQNGYFTSDGIQAFVEAWLHGVSGSVRPAPFQRLTIGRLVLPGTEAVYKAQNAFRSLEIRHRINITVNEFVTTHGGILPFLCGKARLTSFPESSSTQYTTCRFPCTMAPASS